MTKENNPTRTEKVVLVLGVTIATGLAVAFLVGVWHLVFG